jgi:hypothetical protein
MSDASITTNANTRPSIAASSTRTRMRRNFSTFTSSDHDDTNTNTNFSRESIQKCNDKYKGTVKIKRNSKGLAIYSSKTFAPNQIVLSAHALSPSSSISKKATSHSIQLDWNTHVLMELPAVLLNHSCHANIGVLENEHNAYDFIALRDIGKGEEITFDYECTEYDLSTPFTCHCGDDNSRGDNSHGDDGHGDDGHDDNGHDDNGHDDNGGHSCRKTIRGFKYNSDFINKKYFPFYATYLKQREK